MMLHGVLCVFQTNPFQKSSLNFVFALPLAVLPVEGVMTWKVLRGKEWKWVCPCVILYLVAVIPPVWIAEFDLVIIYRVLNGSEATDASEDAAFLIGHGRRNLSAHPEKSLLGIDTGLSFKEETRILMEEILLLVLIIGRWILPRQQISKEQKSALLIGYIGMSADILELYEYFKDDRLKTNQTIITILLSVWTSAMLQFVFVFTARRVVGGNPSSFGSLLVNTDMWAIVCNLLLQDALFLAVRFYLLVKYAIVSETSVFFLVKNSLLTVLILHRIHSLIVEWRIERQACGGGAAGVLLDSGEESKPRNPSPRMDC
uniref:Transmembrane protein 26 n=1 Tax=Macrostomum lignano TaxID=282301 RepID=A0A1I8HTG8_9PLAT